jgi:cytidyltransferase-like protein
MAEPVWVYVDGVFDLFHRGHVEFFRKARALGDRLIVGIHGDADVARYKPAPILSFEERQAVVAACRHVDRVAETPAPLECTAERLDALGATFCVHGDDMDEERLQFFYADLMPRGRLRTVGYTPSIASREIVARIVDRYRPRTLQMDAGE